MRFNFSIVLTGLFLMGCAPQGTSHSAGPSKPVTNPPPASNRIYTVTSTGHRDEIYPFRTLPNLGGTCYFNVALHYLRHLERKPVVGTSPAHDQVLEKFSTLLSALKVDSLVPGEKQAVDRSLLSAFKTVWDSYVGSQEFMDQNTLNFSITSPEYQKWFSIFKDKTTPAEFLERKKNCTLNNGGTAEHFFRCSYSFLGFEFYKSVDLVNGKLISDGGIGGDRAMLVGKDSFYSWHKTVPIAVGNTVEVDGEKFKILACEGYHKDLHAVALVEDRAVKNGNETSEVFLYDDLSVTWISNRTPENTRCYGRDMIVERTQP
ncbi:MAG: hypothetical protein HYX41_01925 [Bdellovibrio sp.]|nr:hypothetical protein [Bdellovibrio sp.]